MIEGEGGATEAGTVLEARRPALLGFLLHLTGNEHDAEDVLQEVCVAVLKQPDMLTRAGDVDAYLRGVARHLACAQHRLRRRESERLIEWVERGWSAPRSPNAESAEVDALRLCVQKLAGRARELIALRYDEMRPVQEIGTRLSMTANAVSEGLFRARRALAECIRRRTAGV